MASPAPLCTGDLPRAAPSSSCCNGWRTIRATMMARITSPTAAACSRTPPRTRTPRTRSGATPQPPRAPTDRVRHLGVGQAQQRDLSLGWATSALGRNLAVSATGGSVGQRRSSAPRGIWHAFASPDKGVDHLQAARHLPRRLRAVGQRSSGAVLVEDIQQGEIQRRPVCRRKWPTPSRSSCRPAIGYASVARLKPAPCDLCLMCWNGDDCLSCQRARLARGWAHQHAARHERPGAAGAASARAGSARWRSLCLSRRAW